MCIAKTKIESCSIVVLTAALIFTFLFVTPANAGVSPADGRSIGNETNGTFAFIGERNLTFVDKNGTLIPEGYLKSAWDNSNINIYVPNNGTTFDSIKASDLLPGSYAVTNLVGDEKTRVYFASTDELIVKTRVCGEYFSWVTRGGNITFDFEAYTKLNEINGSLNNTITYKLLGPNGVQLYVVNGVSLSDLNISGIENTSIEIDTTGLDLGTYTLSIKTDPDTNNGLDAEGPAVTFEVRSIGVTIEAKPKEQSVTEEIVFPVSTTPHTNITLTVTSGADSNVWFKEGVGSGEVETGGHSASGKSDKNGNFKAVASFTETGDYKITATELTGSTTASVTVTIKVFKPELTAPVEGVYYIGKVLTIKGSANAGDNMTIKIDGSLFKEDAAFGVDYDWSTEESTIGVHKIEMWVLPLSDPEQDLPDASVTILLLRGGVSVKPSAEFVARGDDFTIGGTVPGRDCVDVMTIAPKGGGGKGLDADDVSTETDGNLSAPGLTHYTCGVTGETFEKDKIKVSENADTGTYLIVALNYGRDRKWGKSGSNNLLSVISNAYTTSLASKTTEQILAILKDKTINAAGSDDLLCMATLKVENGFVNLNDIEDVQLGKDIKVTGITNRKVDMSIIVTVEGLEDNAVKFKPKIKKVEKDDKNLYNMFSVSFATEAAKIGEYLVTADDGDGHMDTTTVNIVPVATPSVNVSNSTPTAAGIQSQGTSQDLKASSRASQAFTMRHVEDYAGRLSETGRGYLNRIKEAVERMNALIKDLLKLVVSGENSPG